MAVRNTAALLLLATLVAAVSFMCITVSAAARSEGLHDRRLLSQSTERIEPRQAKFFFSKVAVPQMRTDGSDYGPPVVNPPIHTDPPGPTGSGILDSLQDSVHRVDPSDIHTDYANPGTHPPDYSHDYPPGWPGNGPPLDEAGAKMSAKTWNSVTSSIRNAAYDGIPH